MYQNKPNIVTVPWALAVSELFQYTFGHIFVFVSGGWLLYRFGHNLTNLNQDTIDYIHHLDQVATREAKIPGHIP